MHDEIWRIHWGPMSMWSCKARAVIKMIHEAPHHLSRKVSKWKILHIFSKIAGTYFTREIDNLCTVLVLKMCA